MPKSTPFKLSFLSGESFREIFQSAAEGIMIIDRDGTIIMTNPVAEQMFGYEKNELLGLTMERLIPERFRMGHQTHRADFHKNPSPRRMGVGRDLMALRNDGIEFPVEISLSYREINGHFLVLAFIIDITERKRSEEALKRSEEQLIVYAAELERKVRERTETLDKTINKLEKLNKDLQEQIIVREKAEAEAKVALERERELNELKSKFVSMASHEFRTPLSAILSSASLIGQYNNKGEQEKIDRHVNRVKTSVNHLTNILNDVLSLGKLEEGRVEVSPENIHLPEFMQEVKEELKSILKEEQQLETTIEGHDPYLFTDPKILRNILFNLISNAIKYSAPGKHIRVVSRLREEGIEIDVMDEGIGIPDEDVKHVFERFFRASNVTNIQGTGLGLNIVKRYVGLLNGTIQFASKFGKGSTFTVRLPNTLNA
jgi:PAS domain S-box-containing protein